MKDKGEMCCIFSTYTIKITWPLFKKLCQTSISLILRDEGKSEILYQELKINIKYKI